MKIAFLLISMTFGGLTHAAEPAFEAYYKFILGGQHSGYTVQRLEIDAAKKVMTSTYYTYVKTPGGSTTESLVAKCDLNFEPISYMYSVLMPGKTQIIDGSFKNKKLTAKIVTGKFQQTAVVPVPQNGFMSTFLNYVMLKNGLSVGKSYDFFALAEESPACLKGDPNCSPRDAGFIKGTAAIKSEQKFKGVDSFNVDITFKGIKFSGFVGLAGETLASISPLTDASTEIVATRAEAVGPFVFNEKHIRALFNGIPVGVKNPLFATKALPTAPVTLSPPQKNSQQNGP